MQRLGITHIYDLRSNNEIERAEAAGRGGVVEWEGCERVFVPVFLDKDYSPEHLAARYMNYSADGTGVRVSDPLPKKKYGLANSVRGSSKLTMTFLTMLHLLTRRFCCILPMSLKNL